MDAADHFGQAPQVEVKETTIGKAPATLSVAPISIDIYRFAVEAGNFATQMWCGRLSMLRPLIN